MLQLVEESSSNDYTSKFEGCLKRRAFHGARCVRLRALARSWPTVARMGPIVDFRHDHSATSTDNRRANFATTASAQTLDFEWPPRRQTTAICLWLLGDVGRILELIHIDPTWATVIEHCIFSDRAYVNWPNDLHDLRIAS